MNRIIRVRLTDFNGAHVKARIWIGQEGSAGLCGDLTMRLSDWADLNMALLYGSGSLAAKVVVEADRDLATRIWAVSTSAAAGVNSSRVLVLPAVSASRPVPLSPLAAFTRRAELNAELAELDRQAAEASQFGRCGWVDPCVRGSDCVEPAADAGDQLCAGHLAPIALARAEHAADIVRAVLTPDASSLPAEAGVQS